MLLIIFLVNLLLNLIQIFSDFYLKSEIDIKLLTLLIVKDFDFEKI